MNITKTVCLIPLALALTATGQEANPFVKPAPKGPPPPTGGAFVQICEHILVPSLRLDAWLDEHPIKDDAAELRAEVQKWVAEGAATLDCTQAVSGVSGITSAAEAIVERIYPTDYSKSTRGLEWQFPTAWDTRNCGFTLETEAGVGVTPPGFGACCEHVRMCDHSAPDPLMEEARDRADVFMPRFRTFRAISGYVGSGGCDPFADPSSVPAPQVISMQPKSVFQMDGIYLAAMYDNHDSGSGRGGDPQTERTRLLFFRGTTAPVQKGRAAFITDPTNMAMWFISVEHRVFSDWLQKADLRMLDDDAWKAAGSWRKSGQAAITCALAGRLSYDGRSTCENVTEVIYAREWKPGARRVDKAGKPETEGYSHGAGYETRNVGVTLEAEWQPDPGGLRLRVAAEQVAYVADAVHRRILRDGKWVEDIKTPMFSTMRWHTHLRVARGKWMFLGSGPALDGKGAVDGSHCVLAFVRVE